MEYHDFTDDWVKTKREEWKKEKLDNNDIECYRINYDIKSFASAELPYNHLLVGATLAIERLCCEIDRQRDILERLQNIVTVPVESKNDFISRVKSVLGDL